MHEIQFHRKVSAKQGRFAFGSLLLSSKTAPLAPSWGGGGLLGLGGED